MATSGCCRKEFYGQIDAVIVVRIDRSGKLQNSLCCASCHDLLKCAGIKKIIYTTGEDDLAVRSSRVRDLIKVSSKRVGSTLAVEEGNLRV